MDKSNIATFLRIAVLALAVIMLASNAQAARIERVAEDIIVIEGQIKAGDDDKLADIIQPQDTIVLNSPGGAVYVGLNMYVSIHEAGAFTYITEEGVCASMCSYVWLAGEHRRIEMGGRIGVHRMQPMYLDEVKKNPVDYVNNTIELMGILIGLARETDGEVDSYFWSEWMITPNSEMNWLSRNLIERLER